MTPLFKGFLMGAGLIMAIGAQNAFVLKQGLKKNHLFLTAITCAISDSILIVLGVTGIGFVQDGSALIENILRWGGALFLFGYGIKSFISALRPNALVDELESPSQPSKIATLLALLAFTWLNPHTYVDTFLLLGSVGAQHPVEEQLPFIIGAVSASMIWFFGLTYGSSTLSVYFKNPRAWQVLNIVMGCVMINIGLSLIL